MNRPEATGSDRRVGRLLAIATAVALAIAALQVLPPLLDLWLPARARKQLWISCLIGLRAGYLGAVLAAVVALVVLGHRVASGRRRRLRRPWAARGLLLAASWLFSVGLIETAGAIGARVRASSAAGLAPEPAPPLPLPPPRAGGADEPIDVVVVGESSASGVPYSGRLSLGSVVVRQLQRARPDRRHRLVMLASIGIEMREMYRRLAELERRPGIVIVYAGHNEFSACFSWEREVPHYVDEPLSPASALVALVFRGSIVCRMLTQIIDARRVELAPPRKVTRTLVDVPAYTPEEAAVRLAEFRSRVEGIATFTRRIGATLVLVVPPGNDAGAEPNRSVLAASTRSAERLAFARAFEEARRLEASDPAAARDAYRDLVSRHPEFAETHHRLARLLRASGDLAGAYEHFARARDLDALPMRCPSAFQEVYREVARREGAVLVDGQALLHAVSADGQLDDALFNDVMHPSLLGHLVLSQAVVDGLFASGAMGPGATPPPPIDPSECAVHFGMDREAWSGACQLIHTIWNRLAYVRFDPSERLSRAQRFLDASQRLAAGDSPESLALPGVGLPSTLPRPRPAP